MLTEVDKEYLKYDKLIDFCQKHAITDIDTHYYLKLAYEHVKDKLDDDDILDFMDFMYNAFEEHFYKQD